MSEHDVAESNAIPLIVRSVLITVSFFILMVYSYTKYIFFAFAIEIIKQGRVVLATTSIHPTTTSKDFDFPCHPRVREDARNQLGTSLNVLLWSVWGGTDSTAIVYVRVRAIHIFMLHVIIHLFRVSHPSSWSIKKSMKDSPKRLRFSMPVLVLIN